MGLTSRSASNKEAHSPSLKHDHAANRLNVSPKNQKIVRPLDTFPNLELPTVRVPKARPEAAAVADKQEPASFVSTAARVLTTAWKINRALCASRIVSTVLEKVGDLAPIPLAPLAALKIAAGEVVQGVTVAGAAVLAFGLGRLAKEWKHRTTALLEFEITRELHDKHDIARARFKARESETKIDKSLDTQGGTIKDVAGAAIHALELVGQGIAVAATALSLATQSHVAAGLAFVGSIYYFAVEYRHARKARQREDEILPLRNMEKDAEARMRDPAIDVAQKQLREIAERRSTAREQIHKRVDADDQNHTWNRIKGIPVTLGSLGVAGLWVMQRLGSGGLSAAQASTLGLLLFRLSGVLSSAAETIGHFVKSATNAERHFDATDHLEREVRTPLNLLGNAALKNIPFIELDRVTVPPGNSAEQLSNVCMRVNAGELVVVVGDAGSGKSHLLDVIAGEREASQGTAKAGPVPITAIDPGIREKLVCQVGADAKHYTGWTFRGLVETFGGKATNQQMLARLKRAKLGTKFTEVADLDKELGSETLHLSPGEMKKAVLSAVMFTNAKIIVIDDPAADMKIDSTKRFLDALSKKARAGGAIVVVSLNEGRIAGSEHRKVYLENGELVPPALPSV